MMTEKSTNYHRACDLAEQLPDCMGEQQSIMLLTTLNYRVDV